MHNTKFKSGDKVVFCKSSLESGMIDADEGDVFTVNGVYNRTVSLKELPGDYHKTHFEHYVEKEKAMEKYIPKVGDKVRGFKFDDDSYSAIGYAESMDDFVGKQGTVNCVIEDCFHIDFGANCWSYPLELAHLAKIEEPSKFEDSPKEISHEDSQIHWQVGQVVWDVVYGKGEVVNVLQNVLRYPVVVKFVDGKRHFTEDGKTDEEFARTLFFSEPKIIAETMPSKKPFTPTLKGGEGVLLWISEAHYPKFVTILKEGETAISYLENGQEQRSYKQGIKIKRIGEEVKL